MTVPQRPLWLVLLFTQVLAAASARAEDGECKVGLARVKITPKRPVVLLGLRTDLTSRDRQGAIFSAIKR